MIILNPEVVRFEDLVWEDCIGVVIDRAAERVVEEWSDTGPHAAFADVPERRLRVEVTRELARSEDSNELGAAIGRLGWLRLYTSAAGSDAGRRRISVRCVCASVTTEIVQAGAARGMAATARQTITLIGVSPDGGATDPVEIAPAVVSD